MTVNNTGKTRNVPESKILEKHQAATFLFFQFYDDLLEWGMYNLFPVNKFRYVSENSSFTNIR